MASFPMQQVIGIPRGDPLTITSFGIMSMGMALTRLMPTGHGPEFTIRGKPAVHRQNLMRSCARRGLCNEIGCRVFSREEWQGSGIKDNPAESLDKPFHESVVIVDRGEAGTIMLSMRYFVSQRFDAVHGISFLFRR